MIKKIISIVLTAAMLVTLGGCGKKSGNKQSNINGDGVEVTTPVSTPEGESDASSAAETTPTPVPEMGTGATQAPFTDSNTVTEVTTEDIPVAEKKKVFEKKEEPDGYKKYVSGDKKWGILLPEESVPGDEDEGGIVFMLGGNMIAVSTVDEEYEFKNVEEAKEYFRMLDEVEVNNFNVIYDNGRYAGCSFDFRTSIGAWGFCKYACKGGKSAGATAMNMEDDASLNDVLRNTVNSLVVFD